ncbi:hypothetical protein WN55_04030 [Dufourea novaeangliae]|uniref:Uncharacterized protein n=1 Tax=Dufourea novaeangliae TaxID=178035 RepID=A0A154PKW7_DUFNO|nr:hypothetical protein WN55_04030 [Dufourea novaeangliae]
MFDERGMLKKTRLNEHKSNSTPDPVDATYFRMLFGPRVINLRREDRMADGICHARVEKKQEILKEKNNVAYQGTALANLGSQAVYDPSSPNSLNPNVNRYPVQKETVFRQTGMSIVPHGNQEARFIVE